VPDVAPAIKVKVLEPDGAEYHCSVGEGLPAAAAVKLTVAPATTAIDVGCVVIAGAAVTVSAAALVAVVPPALVNSALYWAPLSVAAVAGVIYVADVAPAIAVNVLDPGGSEYHCTVGLGCPVAAALKVAVAGAVTVCAVGWVVMVGATFTVNVATSVVAELTELVNSALNCSPVSEAVVAGVS